jgi:hypothetical protein
MPFPRFFIIPAVLMALTLAYVVANPSGNSVGQVEMPEPTATSTPTATPTPYPVEDLPDGLSGRLTYRTIGELVTVRFPERAAIAREPASTNLSASLAEPSADGQWSVESRCAEDSCDLVLRSSNGDERVIAFRGDYPGWAKWSPAGHALVYSVQAQDAPAGRELVIIDEPAIAQPRALLAAYGTGIDAYEWTAGGSVLVSARGGPGESFQSHLLSVGVDGSIRRLADTTAPAPYFYPSPERRRVAFTQDSPGGWRMFAFDTATEELRDLGNMGSDEAGGALPHESSPWEGKGPMYIAWSPDGTKLAFGGGFEAPYIMTTIDVVTGNVARSQFPNGYPGEIKWSRDGSRIGVSTYDVNRTHHETWVVDPTTGAAKHLLDGCVIVWSPDSRFLAVHGEDEPGIAIVDVASGASAQLTRVSSDVPLMWDP